MVAAAAGSGWRPGASSPRLVKAVTDGRQCASAGGRRLRSAIARTVCVCESVQSRLRQPGGVALHINAAVRRELWNDSGPGSSGRAQALPSCGVNPSSRGKISRSTTQRRFFMLIATDDYAGVVSTRVSAERLALSTAWLTQLHALLPVTVNEVFPTDHLLDHIPTLIGEIAVYLRAPADGEIAANTAVIDKARELGKLRHDQRASVHQVLREYELLGEILETFVAEETERLGLQPTSGECFELQRRLTRSTRTLMRATVETFISEYTTTIQEQNERMQAFNRMASHELRSHLGTLVFAAALLNTDVVRSDPQGLAKVSTTIRSNTDRK